MYCETFLFANNLIMELISDIINTIQLVQKKRENIFRIGENKYGKNDCNSKSKGWSW